MFDLGWTELMVIGIITLIVVGPKDLPKMFRSLGQFTAKARAMAREFQRAMDDAADASGVKDVAKDLRKATDTKGMGFDDLDKMRNWDPLEDEEDQSGTGTAGKVKSKKSSQPNANAPEMSESEADGKARIAADMERLRKERADRSNGKAQSTAGEGAQDKRGTDARNA